MDQPEGQKLQEALQAATGPLKTLAQALMSLELDMEERSLVQRLRRSLSAKQEATYEAREWLVAQQTALLKAELDRLRGVPATPSPLPSFESAALRQQRQRWKRRRCYDLPTVRDEGEGGRIVACAILWQNRAGALLPPPFPSSKGYQCYVSNLCVAASHRRRGLAKRLLGRCARRARAWGFDSLWLEVERSNAPALALYRGLGFQEVRAPRLFASGLLLFLPLAPWGSPGRESGEEAQGPHGDGAQGGEGPGAGRTEGQEVGGRTQADGVFVWEAVQR